MRDGSPIDFAWSVRGMLDAPIARYRGLTARVMAYHSAPVLPPQRPEHLLFQLGSALTPSATALSPSVRSTVAGARVSADDLVVPVVRCSRHGRASCAAAPRLVLVPAGARSHSLAVTPRETSRHSPCPADRRPPEGATTLRVTRGSLNALRQPELIEHGVLRHVDDLQIGNFLSFTSSAPMPEAKTHLPLDRGGAGPYCRVPRITISKSAPREQGLIAPTHAVGLRSSTNPMSAVEGDPRSSARTTSRGGDQGPYRLCAIDPSADDKPTSSRPRVGDSARRIAVAICEPLPRLGTDVPAATIPPIGGAPPPPTRRFRPDTNGLDADQAVPLLAGRPRCGSPQLLPAAPDA